MVQAEPLVGEPCLTQPPTFVFFFASFCFPSGQEIPLRYFPPRQSKCPRIKYDRCCTQMSEVQGYSRCCMAHMQWHTSAIRDRVGHAGRGGGGSVKSQNAKKESLRKLKTQTPNSPCKGSKQDSHQPRKKWWYVEHMVAARLVSVVQLVLQESTMAMLRQVPETQIWW
jgi:hypothetical protein